MTRLFFRLRFINSSSTLPLNGVVTLKMMPSSGGIAVVIIQALRLARCGQRSVTALVDISNYVMFELGRPSHIFDLDKIHGGLDVRWGKPGEQLKLLNGNTVTVDEKVADERTFPWGMNWPPPPKAPIARTTRNQTKARTLMTGSRSERTPASRRRRP